MKKSLSKVLESRDLATAKRVYPWEGPFVWVEGGRAATPSISEWLLHTIAKKGQTCAIRTGWLIH